MPSFQCVLRRRDLEANSRIQVVFRLPGRRFLYPLQCFKSVLPFQTPPTPPHKIFGAAIVLVLPVCTSRLLEGTDWEVRG